jgi:hypothetical protein
MPEAQANRNTRITFEKQTDENIRVHDHLYKNGLAESGCYIVLGLMRPLAADFECPPTCDGRKSEKSLRYEVNV